MKLSRVGLSKRGSNHYETILKAIDSLDVKDKEKSLKAVIAEYFKNDLFAFCKYGLGYKDMVWKTHKDIVRVLESPVKRKLICVPRGTFKSSLAVVGYTIWRLIKDPNLRILIDSELLVNSKKFLTEIAGHMKSDFMVNIFGAFDHPDRPWHQYAITIAQRTAVSREASITCSGIGAEKTGSHFNLIIGDDYNSPSNSDSPDKCQKVIDHFRHNLAILEPDGEYVIIGTRYNERDLIGYVLSDVLGEKELSEGKF